MNAHATPSGTRMMCTASVNAICARAHGTGFTPTINGTSSRTGSASRNSCGPGATGEILTTVARIDLRTRRSDTPQVRGLPSSSVFIGANVPCQSDRQQERAMADEAEESTDTVPTDTVVVAEGDVDIDGDGVPDAHVTVEVEEIDVDGDGQADIVVVTETVAMDVDGDGIPDIVEVTETVAMDVDGDGTADSITVTRATAVDVDGDGAPD